MDVEYGPLLYVDFVLAGHYAKGWQAEPGRGYGSKAIRHDLRTACRTWLICHKRLTDQGC